MRLVTCGVVLGATALLAGCGSKDPPPPAPDTDDGPLDTDGGQTVIPPVQIPDGTDYCAGFDPAPGSAIPLAPGADLQAALDAASAGDVLALATGTYDLGDGGLVITTAGVTLRGAGTDASLVILDGRYRGGTLITVAASDVTVQGMTLARAQNHGVAVIAGETDISGVVIDRLRIVDPAENAVFVDMNLAARTYADGGRISCNHLELTDEGREKAFGNCETGGIDARQAAGWVVEDNLVRGFWCPDLLAEPGIGFTRGSRDTLVLRNAVEDSPLGISLGLGDAPGPRTYDDLPCAGAAAQHYGGRVFNNTVWVGGRGIVDSTAGVEAGIAIDSTCEALVLHNTCFSQVLPRSGIRHQGAITTGTLANNLSSSTIRRSEGSLMETDSNVENAPDSEYEAPLTGDVHLGPGSTLALDEGTSAWLDEVPEDLDGQPRQDGIPDVGADEAFRSR